MKEALNKLELLFEQGRLSRRAFLRRATALGLAATLSPVLMPRQTYADTPKRGGRLRMGLNGGATSDTMDPGIQLAMMPQTLVYGTLANSLVEIDGNGQPVPELAESWEASADAKKWIFKLRKGVEFHNGKSMDADDVIYSLNWHRKEGTKSAAKPLVESIVSMKKEDAYTLVFEMAQGNADFPYTLSDYHLVVGPKDTDLASGVFTGAYVIKDFEPGVRAFCTRNPNYFKSDRAWFDESKSWASMTSMPAPMPLRPVRST
jgi:peptide/nickel transport system substrate-binding protein